MTLKNIVDNVCRDIGLSEKRIKEFQQCLKRSHPTTAKFVEEKEVPKALEPGVKRLFIQLLADYSKNSHSDYVNN
jgi:hypothetical protein